MIGITAMITVKEAAGQTLTASEYIKIFLDNAVLFYVHLCTKQILVPLIEKEFRETNYD